MKTIFSMSLKNVRHEQLKPVFDALEKAFRELGIDYYLIGAIAREVWYAKEDKPFRVTKDVDLAVLTGTQTQYDEVRRYLIHHQQFQASKENAFVLISPQGTQIDLLPFGEIAMDGRVRVEGFGLTNIHVDGFQEVYQSGTKEMEIGSGHQFKVATLPAIVLLKLIAFDDRPEQRLKDPRDIANILFYYFDLQANLVYEEHADLFAIDEEALKAISLQEISGIVIGREMKRIVGDNQVLLARLINILEDQITLKEDSAFIRNMAEETQVSLEEIIKWLSALLKGLS